MKGLYFECSSGISGDMAVAALLDLGANKEVLLKAINSIPMKGFRVEISRVQKNGIDCCDFNVILDTPNHDHDMTYLFDISHSHQDNTPEPHHHAHSHHPNTDNHQHGRNLTEIIQIIQQTEMDSKAKFLAQKIFDIIATAESKAHGINKNQVHFHEVGAVDSIVDVIAFSVCFTNLGIETVFIPHIFEGSGYIKCQHGILPIPVPAVLNITTQYNIPLQLSSSHGEFVTPTGAAFAAAITTHNTLPKSYQIKNVGLGAGKRNYEIPSILRVMQIEFSDEQEDTIIKIESNIDDCTGENLGLVMDLLFKNGAKDVYYIPCFMKKNRPAYVLNVICDQNSLATLENIIFTHTTTIGLRKYNVERSILPRKIIDISTKIGPAKVKVVSLNRQERYYPEYESIVKLLEQTNFSFTEIYNIILDSLKK